MEDILLNLLEVNKNLIFIKDGINFLLFCFIEVISDLEASKYQMAEYRISIYGR
jgi:hypothetical protein